MGARLNSGTGLDIIAKKENNEMQSGTEDSLRRLLSGEGVLMSMKSALLFTYCLGMLSGVPAKTEPSSGTKGQVALVVGEGTGPIKRLAERWIPVIEDAGLSAEMWTFETLTQSEALTGSQPQTLILCDSRRFPVTAFEPLLSFLQKGGDLVLLGGRPFSQAVERSDQGWQPSEESLVFRYAFDEYSVYELHSVIRVCDWEEQDWLPVRFAMDGSFTGFSAVGFTTPHESVYVPLLAAQDTCQRVLGWAGGLLLHHAGPFAGSQWALFGVEDRSFYEGPQFTTLLVSILKTFQGGSLLNRALEEEASCEKEGLRLQSPPGAPLRIRDGHFTYPDGRRFFLVGVNFWSSFDTFYGGGVQWDADRLEKDFERMKRAGINAIRIHDFKRFAVEEQPYRWHTFLELCRRYQIYFLAGLSLGKHHFLEQGKTAMQDEARRFAKLLKDEPMLLGYDLQNEPYAWELSRAPFDDTTLAERFPVPKGAWQEYFLSLKVCEGHWTSTFPGLEGKLSVPEEPRLRQAYESTNALLAAWIGWLTEAIRSEDPTHPITVGYNTILDCLPANAPLDFVSHHVYEHPKDLEHVRINLTTMDRLKRIWPDRPITLGEFGYSSGDQMEEGYLDVYTQAVGEILHYLYALAHDYDGVMKWQLCDSDPNYQWRFATWRRTDPEEKRLRERRFGLFTPDGTPEGRAKPIAWATRFLRDAIDEGVAAGELELRSEDNPIATGYTFKGKNVLFIGGTQYFSPELTFRSDVPANVMLRWNDDQLVLMSTADTHLTLRPASFVSKLKTQGIRLNGRVAGSQTSGDRFTLALLEGEVVQVVREMNIRQDRGEQFSHTGPEGGKP